MTLHFSIGYRNYLKYIKRFRLNFRNIVFTNKFLIMIKKFFFLYVFKLYLRFYHKDNVKSSQHLEEYKLIFNQILKKQ